MNTTTLTPAPRKEVETNLAEVATDRSAIASHNVKQVATRKVLDGRIADIRATGMRRSPALDAALREKAWFVNPENEMIQKGERLANKLAESLQKLHQAGANHRSAVLNNATLAFQIILEHRAHKFLSLALNLQHAKEMVEAIDLLCPSSDLFKANQRIDDAMMDSLRGDEHEFFRLLKLDAEIIESVKDLPSSGELSFPQPAPARRGGKRVVVPAPAPVVSLAS